MNAHLESLSRRFAPPLINLRDGRIADDYGEQESAKIVINHQLPADVTDEELDYYQDVWAFLDAPSLLFYFHPVTNWLSRHPDTDSILFDYYVWSLDRNWPAAMALISDQDAGAIVAHLISIKERHHLHETYSQCSELFA